jgi:hypothetical protein
MARNTTAWLGFNGDVGRSPATPSACTWLTHPRRFAYSRGLPARPLLHVHPCVVIPRFRHAAGWEPDIRRCGFLLVSKPNPTAEDQEKFELLFLWKDSGSKWLKNRKLAAKKPYWYRAIFYKFPDFQTCRNASFPHKRGARTGREQFSTCASACLQELSGEVEVFVRLAYTGPNIACRTIRIAVRSRSR